MRTLVVLTCIVAAAAACIPTKTPEPGIPAMPPATKTCDQFQKATNADCTSPTWPNFCDLSTITTGPTLTATAMSCPTGKNILVVQNRMTLLAKVLSATCVNGVWKDNMGADLFATPPTAGTILVACAQ